MEIKIMVRCESDLVKVNVTSTNKNYTYTAEHNPLLSSDRFKMERELIMYFPDNAYSVLKEIEGLLQKNGGNSIIKLEV